MNVYWGSQNLMKISPFDAKLKYVSTAYIYLIRRVI